MRCMKCMEWMWNVQQGINTIHLSAMRDLFDQNKTNGIVTIHAIFGACGIYHWVCSNCYCNANVIGCCYCCCLTNILYVLVISVVGGIFICTLIIIERSNVTERNHLLIAVFICNNRKLKLKEKWNVKLEFQNWVKSVP